MEAESRINNSFSASVQNIMKKKFGAALFGMWMLQRGDAPAWMIFGLSIAVIIAQLIQDVAAQRLDHPVPSPQPETPNVDVSES